jgi:hypothetical protein
VFHLNKFYSLQIDFSPALYNERLISFNNPGQWIQQDNHMERLEEQVKDMEEDRLDPDDVTPLSQIIQAIDEELGNLEKRRARLLYIRNLALGATQNALEEMDRRKKQVVHHIVDQGPTSVEALSRTFQLREDMIRDIVTELEREGLVERENNIIQLRDFI